MKLFGLTIGRERKAQGEVLTLDQLISRLDAVWETASGISITPENCEESPTVHAVVTAISRRIAVSPVHVLKKSVVDGRERKETLADHPVARLLQRPNEWQTATSYWLDAASRIVRYGNFYAFKGVGRTGPIRRLEPLPPSQVNVVQDDGMNVAYRVTLANGGQRDYPPSDIHHVRDRSRDGLTGDSPINRIRESIALEIAAEKFGATFFGNGAMPFVVFQYAMNATGTDEQRKQLVDDFQALYSRRGRHRAMLLPKGIEMPRDPIAVDNDKNQFLATRQYQRTVIAGGLGVPPHLVGDLSKGTFNNVEQQGIDFTQTVVHPYARMFESAMERDLLSDEDHRNGVIIRFNLDASLRSDFKARQDGLKIMRMAGVINANDWRERENMNPIPPEQGGDDYWQQGPSGQTGPARETERQPNDPETPPD